MNWFLSIVIGLLTGITGLLLTGVLASLNVRWYRISSFEGGSGYYVVFIALAGGLIGLITGVICSRIVAGWDAPTFLQGLGLATGSMAGLVFVIGVICRLCADLAPTMHGQALELAIEIKCPIGTALPVPAQDYSPSARIALIRGRSLPAGDMRLNEAVQVDGRWIVPATVPLTTSKSRKLIHAYFNQDANHTFWLPLRSHPNEKDLAWSKWVEAGWSPGTEKPKPENNFMMRVRVQIVEPEPPGPTQAELDARRAAEEQAKFEAIPADAPITTWLPYTRYGADPARLRIAIDNIQSREDFTPELGALMTGDDHETAAAALWMVQHLELFPPELHEQVSAAGRKIAGMIRIFNDTPVDQDPSMQGAADVSVRFSSWMEAVRTLRKNSDSDFTPELGEILELSRVRQDSYCMRTDVRRVASYYMKEWAGLAPLAGDPPPR